MKSKISKITSIIFASIFGLSLLGLAPTVHAADDVCNTDAAPIVKEAAGCEGNTDALPGLITGILNAIIAVSGIVAVIFVLIGGVNYMTSSGDSGKLEKAKKTILYACIGLIITALAFAIVNFTISGIINGQSTSNNTEDNSSHNTNNSSPKYDSKLKCENAGYNWNDTAKECVQ